MNTNSIVTILTLLLSAAVKAGSTTQDVANSVLSVVSSLLGGVTKTPRRTSEFGGTAIPAVYEYSPEERLANTLAREEAHADEQYKSMLKREKAERAAVAEAIKKQENASFLASQMGEGVRESYLEQNPQVVQAIQSGPATINLATQPPKSKPKGPLARFKCVTDCGKPYKYEKSAYKYHKCDLEGCNFVVASKGKPQVSHRPEAPQSVYRSDIRGWNADAVTGDLLEVI